MLLGTMLGDAGIYRTAKTARYISRHGWVQRDYNAAKYRVLHEFVRTPPRRQRNRGYGKWSSIWATLSVPVFNQYMSLCCPDGRKQVSEAWLSRLTWEAVAWWYQDDGTLQQRAAVFNTQSFSQAEVEMLAAWLTRMGTPAEARQVRNRRRNKIYWVVRVSTAAAKLLFQHIRPWIVPSMMYKLDATIERGPIPCSWCGTVFTRIGTAGAITAMPTDCCGSPQCERARGRANERRYRSRPGVTAAKNAKQRQRYHANLDASRAKARRQQAAYVEKNRDVVNARKRAKSRLKAAARAASPWVCRRCGLTEPQGARDSKTKYCAACRVLVTQEIKQRSAARRRGS